MQPDHGVPHRVEGTGDQNRSRAAACVFQRFADEDLDELADLLADQALADRAAFYLTVVAVASGSFQ